MKPVRLFFLMGLLLFSCARSAPVKPPLPANEAPPVAVEEVATGQEEDDSEYLESDGSLDLVLGRLRGKNAPVFDTGFHLLNPDGLWQETIEAGKCHLRRRLDFPGYTVRIDEERAACPDNIMMRFFMGDTPEKLTLQFNQTALYPAAYRYQISGDSVALGWDYEGGFRKMKFYEEDWLVVSLFNPAANGSTSMYEATLLAKMNGPQPEFYFFDHFPSPGLLADTDGDKRLEWLEMDYGNWQQDTIRLKVTPYELNDEGRFKQMKDAAGKPYRASIQYENGFFDPRNARLLKKYWPN